MNPSPTQLYRILELLTASQVRFVVVGGLAMILQGADNCERLVRLLNEHHPRPLALPQNSPFTLDVARLNRARFLNLTTDLGEIDLLPHLAGIDSFDGLLARASSSDLGTFAVAIASIDDLIAMKEAAGRPKDQLHLMELRALKSALETAKWESDAT